MNISINIYIYTQTSHRDSSYTVCGSTVTAVGFSQCVSNFMVTFQSLLEPEDVQVKDLLLYSSTRITGGS